MESKGFSNREIRQLIELSDAHHNEAHQAMLSKIEVVEITTQQTLDQTKKTNGRVSTLEDQEVVNKVFRARITTAIGILTFLTASVLIPIISSYISSGKL